MFARQHLAGMSDFWLVCAKAGQVVKSLMPGIVVASVFRKEQASEFVLIRGYTIKQLNKLIVAPII